MTTPDDELTPGWQQPTPLGYGQGAKEAQFVAAPLLAAAALGLAGVVAGAKDQVFLLPGPTLLMLVLSAMSLIYSIQLAYHARKFLYSQQDVLDWYGAEIAQKAQLWGELRRAQSTDFKVWERYIRGANRYFNRGTILLAFGVAAALAPGKDSSQPPWRWWAAGVVLVCAFGEIGWQLKLRREVNDRSKRKRPGIGQGGSP
ncbi:membrane protein implicated in regulation of membrane protease activity [Streptomyces canus]